MYINSKQISAIIWKREEHFHFLKDMNKRKLQTFLPFEELNIKR